MAYSLIIAVFIIFLRIILGSPKYKGKVGEKKVSRKLKKFTRAPYGYCVIDNAIFRTPDGTTQIDHILITPFGIFVIETKNMSGWIFGGVKQKKWTQVLYKNKISFQNPIFQNYKHIMAIQDLIGVDRRLIFNIVVFVGYAKFKSIMPSNIIRISELQKYIKSHTQIVFSESELNRVATILLAAINCDLISEKEHIENIKRNRINPLCPKCGSKMVLRSARKGQKAGSNFWGCSNFPTCSGTKNIN